MGAKEAERYRKQDMQRVQRIEAKNELETCIYQVLDVVSQLEDNGDKKLAGVLRLAAEKEQAWLDDGHAATCRISDIRMRIRKCVEMDPDWGKGYSRQGQALCAMGEYAKAIAIYAQGLGKDPTNKL